MENQFRLSNVQISRRHNSNERGSALLVVLVMAAAIAILLYMELPMAAFEAQRRKEQHLIDNGNEYVHAIRLYVRKFGRFPPSLDALEDTNRMRFLRHRFKDPLNGSEEWRLVHAGPGGLLADSKVSPAPGVLGPNSPGQPVSSSDNSDKSVFAGFNNSISNDSGTTTDVNAAPPITKRPPAIAANAGDAANPDQAQAEPNTPATPTVQAPDPLASAMKDSQQQTSDTTPADGQQTGTKPNGTGAQNIGAPAPMQMMGGGIAGVASLAHGHSIKKIHEQTDYSLWEFYYDPTKDPFRLSIGIMSGSRIAPGDPTGNGAPGFGAPPQSNVGAPPPANSGTPVQSPPATAAQMP
jgi:hypothetical protein